jgi:anthranilate synthase component 2
LGQQAIGEVFGGKLENLNQVFHGIATKIEVIEPNDLLFNNLPPTFDVGRYHSWVISKENFPEDLEITSIDTNGEIMSISHKKFDVKGVQFHPESILTPNGKQILGNWLNF